jgi:hypothetical protein
MKKLRTAALSLLLALALPFPGPHVDGWLPLAAVAWHGASAPAGFWLLFAAILGVYALIVSGLLAVAAALLKRKA